jgi:hypothetical protein
MRASAAFLLILVLALASAPVTAEVEEIVPTFRTERTYFHCETSPEVKLRNVTSAQGVVDPFDTTPPSASVTDGAGCGQVEYGIGGNQFDMQFEGTFTGNLRTLTVELHEMAQAQLQPFPTEVLVTLEIDGAARLEQTSAVSLPVEPQNSGVTNRATFSVTNLGYASEDGDGTIERHVKLTISSPIRGAAFWVWDTTEVPAGITFNPATEAATRFPATS